VNLDQLAKHLPAIPKEWQLALAQAAVACAVAFGAPLNAVQQTTLVSLSALALTLLVAGGTWLRRGRLKHLGPTMAAQVKVDDALVDSVLAALQARTGPPTPPRGGAVTRQLTRVEDAGATLAAAEAANAEQGEPPPAEPTGS
jgi:hypothetical protein